MINITNVKPYEKNPRKNDKAVDKVAASIKEFGFKQPLVVDKDGVLIVGHTRMKAAQKLGIKEVPVIYAEDLTDEQVKAYRLADNQVATFSEWNDELLTAELGDLKEFNFDMEPFGFEDIKENVEVVEDDFDSEQALQDIVEPITKRGDIWQLGKHRLMCGDSTVVTDIERLMDGKKAVLAHNDPPYGMKKECDGVTNDNLNYDDLLEFNRQWIPLQFSYLADNGSWYCWGIDEPLMDIYSEILKPFIKTQKATFRNLITWNKGNGQGQMAEEFRSYAVADEKCLFMMCGVQGFNNNADNYFEGWEPIRDYLLKSRLEMGWDIPTMKKIVGHSDLSRDHWTSKSQFNMPTKEVYNKMKEEADRLRKQTNNDAFKKEYDELKKEYYSTRAYFNNTHDNMNNVWNIKRTPTEEKDQAGGHATPKPLELCSRVIKSSSQENDLVIDMFGGSGSTLIACEELNRICYTVEYEPKWCDVIIKRYETLTGNKAELIKG